MIKFFRKIRQNLLSENKFSKYLLYAIGEILLVMIGILLALQVNNWNENRKDLKKEQLILQNLEKNLVFNLRELNQTFESTKIGYNASLQLLELIKPESSIHATYKVDSLIAVILTYYTYDPATGVIDEIINSGQLNIIRNEELKNLVSNWSRVMTDVQKNFDIADGHLYNVLIPYLMENSNLRNIPRQPHLFRKTDLPKIPPSNFRSDYKPLVTSLKFENLVNQHSWNLIWIINEYMDIQSYLEMTISLLENEIQYSEEG
jgi:hypothetical protein